MAAESPTKVLICQLLRMQYPSVYGNGHNVAISPSMKVKPFVFLLDLLERDDLGGTLTSDEIAIAVVYGRTAGDEDRCAKKILEFRESGNFRQVIDRLEDICTPRRWQGDEEVLWDKGIEDAKTIGNTFKCYMEAVGLLVPAGEGARCFEAHIEPGMEDEVRRWRKEPIESAPVEGYESRWQIRFGRWDKEKAQQRQNSRRVNGFASLISSRYFARAKESPYEFDHEAFVNAEAEKWHKPKAEIEAILVPFKPKTKDLFRDTLIKAAYSGGEEALVLEKGVTSIFKKLGFDQAFHTGQRKAPTSRDGGYPDIYIKASSMPFSGWADTKATSRYGFPLGDTSKLGSYYKKCWEEIDPKAPSQFFLYIAGGFTRADKTIQISLRKCTQKYGCPVCAITVDALCDLVERTDQPSADQLFKAFMKSQYINSASQILDACKELEACEK